MELVPLHRHSRDPVKDLAKILKEKPSIARDLPSRLAGQPPLELRTDLDIYNFLSDVNNHKVSNTPHTLSLKRKAANESSWVQNPGIRRLQTLQLEGASFTGSLSGGRNPVQEFLPTLEDDLRLRTQWVGCAGDIITISWVSNHKFICGTTEHSDAHNQQYNKPGNLLLCSTRDGSLRAFPDHRIPRPVIERGENSTDAMRQSQSPWLYASVVCSDFCKERDIAFTSAFDHTVKIWKVPELGDSMDLLGTWPHDGNVNFVAVSKHESQMVATAADVSVDSVRVYNLNLTDLSASSYESFGHRIGGPGFEPQETDKWAYFPATIQWGIANGCNHHLLVGYSPRSLSTDDNDIPEERRNTGAMRLWNTLTNSEVALSATIVQNVFEVAWHPTRPVFIVATSVPRQHPDHRVRTQIRVFSLSINSSELVKFREENSAIAHNFSPSEFYTSQQILDCFSSDINELTIRPNSLYTSYVTAATTDGRVYVYDTARGDLPIHVLHHGDPIEELNEAGEREKEDVGVMFSAWGRTLSRFYTGSSDGVIKVWDLQRQKNPFVRDLLEVAGPVSFGVFSPHFDKLAIGDGSGRVFLLTNNPLDESADDFVTLPGGQRRRRPRPFIPHNEPPPPPMYVAPDKGSDAARRYLEARQLIIVGDPTRGVFQGPNYHETALYDLDSHWNRDAQNPLHPTKARHQQQFKTPRRSVLNSKPIPKRVLSCSALEIQAGILHKRNRARDVGGLQLHPLTRAELEAERCEIQSDYGLDEDVSDDDYMVTYEGGEALDPERPGFAAMDMKINVPGGFHGPNGVTPQPNGHGHLEYGGPDDSSGDDDEIPATLNNASWNKAPRAQTCKQFLSSIPSEQAAPAIEDSSDSEVEERRQSSFGGYGGAVSKSQKRSGGARSRSHPISDFFEYISGSDVKDVFTKEGVRIPIVHDDSADEDYELDGDEAEDEEEEEEEEE